VTVIRLLDDPADGALQSLELPGLPTPRFAAVLLADAGDGIEVRSELRRGPIPDDAPFRMMSVARRDPTLTRAEFVERWRAEAGALGGEVIPDDVRGLAYVQHHPLGDDPPYDAINEVWFDSLESLVRRAEWFATRPVPALFTDSFTLYLREPPTFSGG
jgi:hypothetical protein